jgi:hypothetical protein
MHLMQYVIPPRRKVFADGSNHEPGGQPAVVRALDAGAALRRSVARVVEALDEEITEVHGPQLTDLNLEDSAVILVDEARTGIRKPPR